MEQLSQTKKHSTDCQTAASWLSSVQIVANPKSFVSDYKGVYFPVYLVNIIRTVCLTGQECY